MLQIFLKYALLRYWIDNYYVYCWNLKKNNTNKKAIYCLAKILFLQTSLLWGLNFEVDSNSTYWCQENQQLYIITLKWFPIADFPMSLFHVFFGMDSFFYGFIVNQRVVVLYKYKWMNKEKFKTALKLKPLNVFGMDINDLSIELIELLFIFKWIWIKIKIFKISTIVYLVAIATYWNKYINP